MPRSALKRASPPVGEFRGTAVSSGSPTGEPSHRQLRFSFLVSRFAFVWLLVLFVVLLSSEKIRNEKRETRNEKREVTQRM